MPSRKASRLALLFLSFSYQSIMEILTLALPIFALSLSASPYEIGLLAASRGIAYSIFAFLMGYASEKIDRKRMLVYATSIDMFIALLFYFSRVPLELIALRFFEGLAMAIFWPAIEPLFLKIEASSVSEALRDFNLSWGFGGIIGPIIAGGLITIFGERSPFLAVIAIAAIDTVLIARYTPPRKSADDEGQKPPVKMGRLPIKLVSTTILLGAIMAIFFAFFPAFGIQLGISAFEIGVMLFLFGVARLFFFYVAPSIRMSLELRIALISVGLFMVYIGNKIAIYLGVIFIAAADSFLYAYAIENMLKGEESTRGRMAGIFEGSLGVGYILGPYIAGLAAELSFSYTFIIASLIGVIFIAVLTIARGLKIEHSLT